jgi:hypothetical protein
LFLQTKTLSFEGSEFGKELLLFGEELLFPFGNGEFLFLKTIVGL